MFCSEKCRRRRPGLSRRWFTWHCTTRLYTSITGGILSRTDLPMSTTEIDECCRKQTDDRKKISRSVSSLDAKAYVESSWTQLFLRLRLRPSLTVVDDVVLTSSGLLKSDNVVERRAHWPIILMGQEERLGSIKRLQSARVHVSTCAAPRRSNARRFLGLALRSLAPWSSTPAGNDPRNTPPPAWRWVLLEASGRCLFSSIALAAAAATPSPARRALSDQQSLQVTCRSDSNFAQQRHRCVPHSYWTITLMKLLEAGASPGASTSYWDSIVPELQSWELSACILTFSFRISAA